MLCVCSVRAYAEALDLVSLTDFEKKRSLNIRVAKSWNKMFLCVADSVHIGWERRLESDWNGDWYDQDEMQDWQNCFSLSLSLIDGAPLNSSIIVISCIFCVILALRASHAAGNKHTGINVKVGCLGFPIFFGVQSFFKKKLNSFHRLVALAIWWSATLCSRNSSIKGSVAEIWLFLSLVSCCALLLLCRYFNSMMNEKLWHVWFLLWISTKLRVWEFLFCCFLLFDSATKLKCNANFLLLFVVVVVFFLFSALNLATETIVMLLKIDDILMTR